MYLLQPLISHPHSICGPYVWTCHEGISFDQQQSSCIALDMSRGNGLGKNQKESEKAEEECGEKETGEPIAEDTNPSTSAKPSIPRSVQLQEKQQNQGATTTKDVRAKGAAKRKEWKRRWAKKPGNLPSQQREIRKSTPKARATVSTEKTKPKAQTPQQTEAQLKERAEVLKQRLTEQTAGKTRGSALKEVISCTGHTLRSTWDTY
eukprot:6182465-Amphidinium_carterae.1